MDKLKDLKVDKIYVINMEKDKKRKENTIKTLKKYEIEKLSKNNDYEIIKAHDWSQKQSPISFNGPRNGGAYGCCLSHLQCIDNAIARKYDKILIMEDDLMFHKDFKNEWNKIEIPNSWNILYLSATQLKWNNIVINEKHKYYKAWKSLGGTAYILKSNMFLIIKKLFVQYRKPIDELLIIAQDKYLSIVLYPNLCINYMNESNIRKNNSWKIETTGKKLRWDLNLYDKSIILEDQKVENKEELNINYKINIIKIGKNSKTQIYNYKNESVHLVVLQNECNIYINNKFYKELRKNDHINILPNNNFYLENKTLNNIEILESIIYI